MGKILFMDLSSGVSGDMFAGALYSLLDEDERAVFRETVNSAGLPGVQIEPEKVMRNGISAVKMHVRIDGEEEGADGTAENEVENVPRTAYAPSAVCVVPEEQLSGHSGHHHHGHSMSDIEAVIDRLVLDTDVKKSMKEIYALLAQAESTVHGVPVTDIHFHEVGTIDAIADIMNACVLMKLLSPDAVDATPVNVGNGTVQCAHGILPVPAPATAELLKGLPVKRTPEENPVGELATPTGAALVKYFVSELESGSSIVLCASGFGAGSRELPNQANVLRADLGEPLEELLGISGQPVDRNSLSSEPIDARFEKDTEAGGTAPSEDADNTDSTITELVFNVDDMTGEDLSFAMDCLRDGGATEAYFTPVFMKKGRPGYQVTVLCPAEARDEIIHLIFLHTTTVGLREYETRRAVLTRHYEKRHTSFGDVTVKVSEGYGVRKEKPEYEDLATIAAEHDMGIRELREALKKEL